MVSLFFFVAGTIGGIISLAFLIGIAIVAPGAFLVVLLIGWGAWWLAGAGSGIGSRKFRQELKNRERANQEQIIMEPEYTGTSLDEEDYLD